MQHSPAFDAVIFDIDNVLIDTRPSYLEAIRWTIDIYLTNSTVPFFRMHKKSRDPQILSPEHVEQFKLLGGFNDDWDCCYGLLIYLLSLEVKTRNVEHLHKAVNLKAFAKKVKERPLKINGIVKILGNPQAITIERISRIFQEIYLGKDLFQATEKKRPVFWKKQGLIRKEKLIFKKSFLEGLKDHGVHLGIATGRPHFEAVHTLRHFAVLDLFEAMTTITEVKKAEQEMKHSLRKPHPYSLLETAKKMGAKKRFLYVGDLPDDILAAQKAAHSLNIKSAGFPLASADIKTTSEELKKARPDFLLKTKADLANVILKGKLTS